MKKKLRWDIVLAGCVLILFYWVINHMDQFMLLIGMVFNLLLPFLLGCAIAFILNVPMKEIEKHLFIHTKQERLKKMRRLCSFLLTVIGVSVIITLALFVIIPEAASAVTQLVKEIPAATDNFLIWLSKTGNTFPEITGKITESINSFELDWQKLLSQGVGSILSTGFAALSGVVSGIVTFFVGIVFAIYLLFQKENLKRQTKKLLTRLFSIRTNQKIQYLYELTNTTFSNFIMGQCLEALILGSMFCIVMLIFRLPYAVLIGIIISLTALVPIVGAFVGCALGALFIAVESPMQALFFIVLFLILQQIEGNLIYPHVVGSSIGLPGMWVLVAVTVGGKLFGVIGMLLFIPICSVCYVLLKTFVNEPRVEKTNCKPKNENG